MNMIKLYAYLAGNLGDDLMVDILLKRYPDCRFYSDVPISLGNPIMANKNLLCTEVLYRKYGRINHLLSILTCGKSEKYFFPRMFKKYDDACTAAIYIGGSLFMQNPGRTVADHIEEEEKRITISPKFLIGSNFGPYQTEEFVSAFSQHFQSYAGITFRDYRSFSLFSNCSQVSYAPDVVLNLDISPYSHSETNTVIISVLDFCKKKATSMYADAYEQFIADTCLEVVRRGDSPMLMSFCKEEGDEAVIPRILDRIDPCVRSFVQKYFYSGNIPEALSCIAKAKYVVATRFHAMILAIRFGKPFFCIAYNPKIINVLNDIGCNAWIHPADLPACAPSELLDSFSSPIDASAYIKDAEKQFLQFEKSLFSADHFV